MAKVYLQDIELAKASDIPDVSTKQDTLVSGENIKTVNGQNLLGSGDIEIDTPEDVMKTKGMNNVTDNFQIRTDVDDLTHAEILADGGTLWITRQEGFKFIEVSINSSGFLLSSFDEDSDDPRPLPITIESAGPVYISSPDTHIGGLANPQFSNDAVPKQYVDGKAATKQDTLVSGTNIKTINNQSILGQGNIEIESGTIEYATTAEAMAVVQEVINARS